MQINNTLFKRKILSFTLIQVALLSFLLILSVAVRLVLYPLSYLEFLASLFYCRVLLFVGDAAILFSFKGGFGR